MGLIVRKAGGEMEISHIAAINTPTAQPALAGELHKKLAGQCRLAAAKTKKQLNGCAGGCNAPWTGVKLAVHRILTNKRLEVEYTLGIIIKKPGDR